jgi:hypothetical protein
MYRNLILSILVAPAVLGLGATALCAQPAPRERACAAILTACEQAGFVRGGARTGQGVAVDCIAPIMRGTRQRPRASRPLPQVDAQLVASCKTQNPNFGQGPAPRPQRPPRPAASPPPPTSEPAPAPESVPPDQGQQPNP